MKIIHQNESTYTLGFAPGEDVMEVLKTFLQEEEIGAAHITGLGAAGEIDIAYYNLETKEYERKVFTEDLEILSLTGNVAIKEDGDTVVHLHGVFGRRDYSTLGGHIFKMVISGAGEVHLTTFPGRINRAYDEKTGLTLMCRTL